MIEAITPQALEVSKRHTLTTLSDQAYQQWRHHPVTAGYLQYLADMIAFYREAAMDLFESGQMRVGDPHVDKNPDSMRGQIQMLRQLHELDLSTIKHFYSEDQEA